MGGAIAELVERERSFEMRGSEGGWRTLWHLVFQRVRSLTLKRKRGGGEELGSGGQALAVSIHSRMTISTLARASL